MKTKLFTRTENPKKRKTGSKLFYFIALTVVLLLTYFIIRFYNLSRLGNISSQKLTEQSLIGQQFFVDRVPNVDSLTLRDIPSFSDIRGMYPYKNMFVVIGLGSSIDNGRVVLLDSDKKIAKENTILRCIYSGALIGDSLFVSCNGDMDLANHPSLSASSMYRINLDTGIIETSYFGDGQTHFLTNLQLISKGNILWGYSSDEVFRYDTSSNTFIFYSHAQLNFPYLCNSLGIYSDNDSITVLTQSNSSVVGCEGGSVYNESTGKWSYSVAKSYRKHYFNSDDFYLNLTKHYSDILPYFFGLSNRINDNFYLFSHKGIYVIKKDHFPAFLKSSTIPYEIEESYVFADETNALMMGLVASQDPVISDRIPILLINLRTGSVLNLSQFPSNAKLLDPLYVNNYKWLSRVLVGPKTYEEQLSMLIVKDKIGVPFMKINLQTKIITFLTTQ